MALPKVQSQTITETKHAIVFDPPVNYNGYAIDAFSVEVTKCEGTDDDSTGIRSRMSGRKLNAKGVADARTTSGYVPLTPGHHYLTSLVLTEAKDEQTAAEQMAAFENYSSTMFGNLNLEEPLRAECLQAYREKVIKDVRAAFMGEV